MLAIPANVATGVGSRWPERAEAWLAGVLDELHDLCRRYGATPREVLPARYGFVVAADTTDGSLVMRASTDPDGPRQARVAAVLAKFGVAPAVHETITTDTGTWMVLDEIRPGTPLAKAHEPRATIDSLAAPLAAIAANPAPVPGLPSIVDWLRPRLEDDPTCDRAPGTDPESPHIRRAARSILDQLAEDTVPQLCHGDASTWNVLAHGTDGWMLVDPRGMNGEAAYDVGVLGLKVARGRPPTVVTRRLAVAVGVDPGRARAWMTIAAAARV